MIVLRSDELASDEVAIHLAGLEHHIVATNTRTYSVRALRGVAQVHDVGLTVVPDADSLLVGLLGGWRGRGRLSLLVMREDVQPGPNRLVRSMRQAVKSSVVGWVRRLPRVSLRTLKPSTWAGDEGRTFARDPTEYKATAQSIADFSSTHDLDSDLYWFGILGAINPRKNVGLVLSALLNASPRSVGVLIAGKLDPMSASEIKAHRTEFASRGLQLRCVDRLLTDIELDSALGAIDCVVLAHSNEGPSGLFAKALVAGRRIASAGAASLREDSKIFPEAASWSPLLQVPISAMLTAAIAASRPEPKPDGGVHLGELLIGQESRG